MKHRKFPAPQIAEAVFRGRKTPYNFEVYPINVEFNEVPAVYIISKRKIDRYGRAHHAIVCLGQTVSLAAELKNHKKGKCVKQLKANAVSVLLSENEKSRLAIEADLKAAHAIPCLHNLESKKTKRRENNLQIKATKLLPNSEPKPEKSKDENLKTPVMPKLKIGKKINVSKLKPDTKSKTLEHKTVVQNHPKTKLAKAETSVKTRAFEQKSRVGGQLKNAAPVKSKAKTVIKLITPKLKALKPKTSKTPLAKKAKTNFLKKKKVEVSSPKTLKKPISLSGKIKANSAQALKMKNPKAKANIAERKTEASKPKRVNAKLKVEKVKSQAKNVQLKAKPIKAKLIEKRKNKIAKPASKANKSNLAKAAPSKKKTAPGKTKHVSKITNSKLPSSLPRRSIKLKAKTTNGKKQPVSHLGVKAKKPKTAVKKTSLKTTVKKPSRKAVAHKRLAF